MYWVTGTEGSNPSLSASRDADDVPAPPASSVSPAPMAVSVLQSMTGFGRGTARAGAPAVEVTAEVRAVNGRFAEVTLRAPRGLAPYEAALASRVRDRVGRGTVTVSLAVGDPVSAGVDAAAVRAAADHLRAARDAAGLDAAEAPIALADVLRLAEGADAADPDPADAAAAAHAALTAALDALDAMRTAEGAALAADLAARADALETRLAAVETRAPVRVAEARTKLAARLAALLADAPEGGRAPDPARLELEVALLADRLDVTEECVRLRSHLAQVRAALAGDEAVGRRLGFLVQEVGREINTIGSKANDPETAHLAVGMKEELEKAREQIANVL